MLVVFPNYVIIALRLLVGLCIVRGKGEFPEMRDGNDKNPSEAVVGEQSLTPWPTVGFCFVVGITQTRGGY